MDSRTRPIDLSQVPGWEHRPCRGTPTALWFGPEGREEALPERTARQEWAKALCRRCPVLAACLAKELEFPITHQHGVRGGMTANERKDEIRRRRAAA
jgi:WhiB family transcriptional regulator, redox-sensing transcriptional regulator